MIIDVFREKLEYLKKRGFKPRFNILDNIASKAIVKFLKEEAGIGIQLMEPHNHQANAAEQAIRAFKSHHRRAMHLPLVSVSTTGTRHA